MESIWQNWSIHLQHKRLRNFVVWLLEASEPAHLLGAQLIYVGQPLLSVFVPNRHIQALVNMLEKPAEAKAFAVYLQEDH